MKRIAKSFSSKNVRLSWSSLARAYASSSTSGSVLDTVGNTPLVRLKKFETKPGIEVWAKLEMFNPSGSIKDRIVRHIINNAEKTGKLKPGGTIVENTSGNTGAAIAMIAAAKGYKAILTMPDKVSKEKQDTLVAYGAKIVVCPTSAPPSSPDHYENQCKAIAKSIPGSFIVDQYDNPLNPEAHYLTTGPEIWKQTNGRVTHFVASGSTGGTVSGTSKYLKEQNPKIITAMPDPIGSIYYQYWKTGSLPKEEVACTYFVEGIGEDHVAKAIDFKMVDRMYPVKDKDSFACVRKLAQEEGILCGGSSGSNLYGVLKLQEEITGPAVIVTVFPDNGVKYLSKIYNEEWMKTKQLL
eukprot:TRINITY_DN6550_c0_g1_i1.p1 TRINITY_DN6550_c0_g1~~TRINITY_DN6550_c0_g1_i1.p1  ORF type:complete len:353 (+),score=93.83 TRINITY_DN6550_c0_g1_i1:24-1082(+)